MLLVIIVVFNKMYTHYLLSLMEKNDRVISDPPYFFCLDCAVYFCMAVFKSKWRRAVTVTGRALLLKGWYEARRVQQVKRHLQKTPKAKEYRENSEKEMRCSALLADSMKFRAITRAMSAGSIKLRKKQKEQIKSLRSGKGITKTSIRLEVAKLLGCGDTFQVGEGHGDSIGEGW